MKRRLFHFLEDNLFRLLRLIGWVIPDNWIGPLGRMLGTLFYYMPVIPKKRCMDQIGKAFPEMSPRQVRELTKAAVYNWAKVLLEQLLVSESMINSMTQDVQGVEEMDRTFRSMYEKGRGVILVGAHMNNWEASLGLGARYLTETFGAEVNVLVDRMPTPYLERLATVIREKILKCNVVYIKQALFHIGKILNRKGVVVFGVDVDAGYQGIFVPFLDRQMSMVRGPAFYALKYNVPIGFLVLYRDRSGAQHVHLEEIQCASTGSTRERAYRVTAEIASRIDQFVRRYPDQWFGWLQQPWKTRPMEELQQRLEKEPDNVEIMQEAGLFCLARNKVAKATGYFNKALEADPDCHLAHLELARIISSRGEMEQAIFHLYRALEIRPGDSETLKSLGNYFFDFELYRTSLLWFRSAIRKKYDDPESHWGKGRCLEALGRTRQALRSYRKGLRIDYDYVPLHQAMMRLYAERPAEQENIEEHEQAMKSLHAVPDRHIVRANGGRKQPTQEAAG